MTHSRRRISMLFVLFVVGCREKVLPEPDFERMVRQEKYVVWAPCEFFPDGRTMQRPPEGTVASDAAIGDPAFTEGIVDGAYAPRIPVTLTVPFVERGRDRFETFCAPCHGIVGDGNSRVATNMTLRPPPSLVGPVARGFPPGRIYRVIVDGYGLMPRYADELPSIEERWAVVAYLEALQTSRGVDIRALPPELREKLERARP